MKIFSHEEFAALRRSRQDVAIEALLPYISRALGNYETDSEWWRPILMRVRVLFNEILTEDSGGDVTSNVQAWRALAKSIREVLPKTTEPTEYTARTIATWLASYTINSAAETAALSDPEDLVMVWVTMHDDDVRTAHKDVDGQARPIGVQFDVGGEKMWRPGDPSVPIELWINCRCALRPDLLSGDTNTVTASEKPQNEARVIVALPAKDDSTQPLYAADKAEEGEELQPIEGHMTLCWLGQVEENPELNLIAVAEALGVAAASMQPFTASVTEVDNLGDDGALVWMLSDLPPTHVRNELLAADVIEQAVKAVKQHPQFTPHVTIGYDVPLSGDGVEALSSVEQIKFDRLALWAGEDHYEYQLASEATVEEAAMTDTIEETEVEADAPVVVLTWHAVLAPEGVWSGDKRMFSEGSLRFRDLPLPITWQKASSDGHAGSVVVAKAERIERVGNEMRASGSWLSTPEADEAIGLVAEFGKFGISVDADDAEMELNEETGQVEFTSARIASASMVPIPAFAEAFIALGDGPPDFLPKAEDCDPDAPDYEDCLAKQRAESESEPEAALEAVSDKPWDGSAARFTPEQWKSSCCLHTCDGLEKSCHKLPIKEPGGALSRAGVHAAAGRFGQVDAPAEAKARAKAALRGAYKQLGEDPPDSLTADADVAEFVSVAPGKTEDGPGWLTNPEDTDRLRDYWVRGPGAAKIGWGTSGDFNRCRLNLAQYVKPQYLNGYCANRHYDALGFWPGEHSSATSFESTLLRSMLVPLDEVEAAPALSIVASGGWCAPSEWFKDPELKAVTPLTVTDEGRVFGHLAGWNSCHTAYKDMCVAPPRSTTNYAYFLTGEVVTTDGRVAVGQITMDTGHAKPGRMRPALAHYDNTGSVVCDVACGEDEYGIWLAGWVRPGTPDEKVVGLRASTVSGDWRRINGSEMELIAALAVNTGGFPIPRIGVEDGIQVSLVASGAVEKRATVTVNLSSEALQTIVETVERRQRMAALAERVGSNGL